MKKLTFILPFWLFLFSITGYSQQIYPWTSINVNNTNYSLSTLSTTPITNLPITWGQHRDKVTEIYVHNDQTNKYLDDSLAVERKNIFLFAQNKLKHLSLPLSFLKTDPIDNIGMMEFQKEIELDSNAYQNKSIRPMYFPSFYIEDQSDVESWGDIHVWRAVTSDGIHLFNERVDLYEDIVYTLIVPEYGSQDPNDDEVFKKLEGEYTNIYGDIFESSYLEFLSYDNYGVQNVVQASEIFLRIYNSKVLNKLNIMVTNGVVVTPVKYHYDWTLKLEGYVKNAGNVFEWADFSIETFQHAMKCLMLFSHQSALSQERLDMLNYLVSSEKYNQSIPQYDKAFIKALRNVTDEFQDYENKYWLEVGLNIFIDDEYWAKVTPFLAGKTFQLITKTASVAVAKVMLPVEILYWSFMKVGNQDDCAQSMSLATSLEKALLNIATNENLNTQNDLLCQLYIQEWIIYLSYYVYGNYGTRMYENDWLAGSLNWINQKLSREGTYSDFEAVRDIIQSMEKSRFNNFLQYHAPCFYLTPAQNLGQLDWMYRLLKTPPEPNKPVAAIQLQSSNSTANVNSLVLFSATVKDIDNNIIKNEIVHFSSNNQGYFEGSMTSVKTNEQGIANITYIPSRTGNHTITASCNNGINSQFTINVIPAETGNKIIAYEYWFGNDVLSKKEIGINPVVDFQLNKGFQISDLKTGLNSFHIRFKDIKGLYSQTNSQYFFYNENTTASSKIIEYEYWFDNKFSTRVISEISPAQSVIFFKSLSTKGLSKGFHTFHIRFKDEIGLYSQTSSYYFFNQNSVTGSNKISNYEYWFNDKFDERISNSITNAQSVNFINSFTMDNLSPGLHTFHIRFKDGAGSWSGTISWIFFKNGYFSGNPNLISAYRYWFNRDEENMQFINLAAPANPYELIRDISVSGLPSGDNTIHFQFRDTRQAWSSVVTDTFNYESLLQEITLKTGWNIFSVGLQPQNSGLDIVSQKLINTGSLVKVQDEGGNSFEDLGINGGWQNNIGTISVTEGYKIKVNRNDTLKVSGSPVTYPYAIPLKKGWNIAGYPQQTDFSGMNLVQQLADKGTLIKVQDEGGNSIEDWGIYGSWQNNIGNFMAGEGYKIKVSADDTLWIYENYPNSSAVLPELAGTSHFKRAFEGYGFDHMNINLVGLPTHVFNAGDELAVYDGANCVGAVVLTLNHLQNRNVSIAASSTDSQGMPGFVEGKPIILRFWSSKIKKEFSVVPEIVKGTSTFIKNETTVASLEKFVITALDDLYASDQPEINCYPNPFSDEITIEISLFDETGVDIEVLNQLGQKVKSIAAGEQLNRGVHRLTWDGTNAGKNKVAPGIYLIRMKISDMVYYRKVVYSK